MVTLKNVLDGVAAAMEAQVPSLSETIGHEYIDGDDGIIDFPHGEIVIVDNARATAWNTDLVGYKTDNSGNRTDAIYDALFETALQCNIWLAVPSEQHDIGTLGGTLERGLRTYDDQQAGDPLPDGNGGTLSDVDHAVVSAGGTLPIDAGQSPSLRGYQVPFEVMFRDQTTVAGTPIETVDVPSPSQLDDGNDQDAVAIEYNA